MALDPDDLPQTARPKLKDLEPLGVAELEDYLSALLTETERVKAKIAAKKAYLSGVAGLFKT